MALLLKENVDPDSRGKDNRTPLSYAAKKGHETIVKQLLEKKNSVDPDSKDVDEPDTAIICCRGGARDGSEAAAGAEQRRYGLGG